MPQVVGRPTTSNDSFTLIGRPCKGPQVLPSPDCCVGCPCASSGAIESSTTMAFNFALTAEFVPRSNRATPYSLSRRDLISEARASALLNETLVMISAMDYPAEQGSDGHFKWIFCLLDSVSRSLQIGNWPKAVYYRPLAAIMQTLKCIVLASNVWWSLVTRSVNARRDCNIGNAKFLKLMHNGYPYEPTCVLRRGGAEGLYCRGGSLGNFAADGQQTRKALRAAPGTCLLNRTRWQVTLTETGALYFETNTANAGEAGRNGSSDPGRRLDIDGLHCSFTEANDGGLREKTLLQQRQRSGLKIPK